MAHNVKKLSAFLALLLALTGPALAQHPVQGTTNNGNFINQGSLTASNLNPEFLTTNQAKFSFSTNVTGVYPTEPWETFISTNTYLLGTITNTSSGSPPVGGPAEIPIYGLRLACIPYTNNAYGGGNYPYIVPETNGIAGGVITVVELTPAGVATTVGTIVVPNAPHGGPYPNTFRTVISPAYVPTYGSVFTAWVTSVNAGPNQGYTGCDMSLYLQSAPQG